MTRAPHTDQKMMSRALALLLLAAVLMLAGCGGGDDDGGGSNDSGKSPAEAKEDTKTDEEEGTAVAAEGESIFAGNCESCHGNLGAGGHVGPNLQTSDVAEDRERTEQVVRQGQGQMPAFEGTLSDEEIEAISDYVTETLAPMG